MPPATYPAEGSRAASSSCRCCQRRRRPREASHQILIGQLGNRIGICSRSADRLAPPAADRSPSNQARQKARQPASPRPRTRSSNPVPSSGESANFQFLARCDCDWRNQIHCTRVREVRIQFPPAESLQTFGSRSRRPADYRTRHAGYGVNAVAWARRWTADQFVITTSLARRPAAITAMSPIWF